MSKRKTLEQFKKEVYDFDSNYEVLGDYIGTEIDILMKHNCGQEFTAKPFRFLSGLKGCPKCRKRGKKSISHEEFLIYIHSLVGDEYKVLGGYVDTSTHVEVKHSICGYSFHALPKDFTRKKNPNRCPICKNRKTLEDFGNEVSELTGAEYSVLNRVISSSNSGDATSFEIIHNVCGYRYMVNHRSFLEGNRCAKCNGNAKKTHEEFVKEVYDMVGDEHKVIGKYMNARKKIEIMHNTCGNISEISPHAFITKGTRCAYCKFSKGEAKISDWLTNRNIDFKPQFAFKDCIHKNLLPFDFAIMNNGELLMLIEFDGKQHYEPIKWYGGEEGFKKQKLRDSIKNNYCKDNNIKLLRISYLDVENIGNILENALKTIKS